MGLGNAFLSVNHMVNLFNEARCYGAKGALILQLQRYEIINHYIYILCTFATEEGPFGAKTSCFIEQVCHVIHVLNILSLSHTFSSSPRNVPLYISDFQSRGEGTVP